MKSPFALLSVPLTIVFFASGCSSFQSDVGWTPVFDGESLDGWHTNPERIGHGTGGRWQVEDGAITGEQDPPGSGNGGILLTDQTFGDFEVSIDLKPDWGVCSGFFVRGNDEGQCFQVMVDYHDGGNVGHIYGEGSGGFSNRPFNIDGVYDENEELIGLKATANEVSFINGGYSISGEEWVNTWKLNDWNTLKVRVEGNPAKLTTWINGAKVTEFDGNRFEDSRYDRDRVAHLLGAEGRIAVQVHGGTSWPVGAKCRWKNVRVRPIN